MKIIIAIVAGLALSACVPDVQYARPDATSGWVFSKPGATQADYAADKSNCQTKAVRMYKGKFAPYGKLNQERQATNQCMTMLGWKTSRNTQE